MKKYIPYEKLSKKEKKKLDALGRATWGSFSPVTRKPTKSSAYKRSRSWQKELPGFGIFLSFA